MATVPVPENHTFFQLEDKRFLALPELNATERPSPTWLQDQIQTWLRIDDVFKPEFLTGMIFVTENNSSQSDLSASIGSLPKEWKPDWWITFKQETNSKLRAGPHMVSQGKLFSVYRVHDDVNGAFMVAIQPQSTPGPFKNLHASGDFYTSLGVAVGSRIAGAHAVGKPLSGVRFAIKDIFEVEGLRTTAGNRAYYSLFNPATKTCPAIKRLIDAGAELLGTLKLGSLIAREEPTESVDYHAPFNPRADGYQSAWSSSGGSGAAIASYDWIDFTLGTDIQNAAQMQLIHSFIDDMEATLGIKTEKVSIADTWKTSPPNEAINISVQEYLKDVSPIIDFTLLLRKRLFADDEV
ncbi:hypothetical protein McanMca71_002662 [Microsporum canis]